jgi:hypothetical protein
MGGEMKPFDLEAAKRGEPVVWVGLDLSTPEPAKFIGMSDDRAVCEFANGGLTYCFLSGLRMAPKPLKKVTLWANVQRENGGHHNAKLWNDKVIALHQYSATQHIAYAVPIEIEIPDE